MKTSKFRFFPSLVLAVLTLLFAACSGSRSANDRGANGDASGRTEIQLSDFEDFDARPYRESPPDIRSTVEHDVPANLLSGRADQGAERVMQGFRIQIFQSLDKAKAIDLEESVTSWWENLEEENRPEGLFGKEIPAYLDYRQPYYRVRIGDFATREEAEQALVVVAVRFPGAFIAPDMVTVER